MDPADAHQSGDDPRAVTTRLALLAHLVTLAGAVVFLLYLNRNQWFFGDEWDFLVERGVLGGRFGLLDPHNEHWSTVPILLYRLVVNVAGLDSYLPFAALVIAAHAAAVHLLWRLCARVGAGPWVATAAAAAFAFLDAGHENLLWAFQVGFVGSLAAGLALILLVTSRVRGAPAVAGAYALGLLSLLCSGIGVSMVACAVAVCVVERRLRLAAGLATSLGSTFLVWLATFGDGVVESGGRSRAALWSLPEYVTTGLSAGLDGLAGGAGGAAFGLVLVLVLAAGFVIARGRGRHLVVPAAIASGAVVILLVAGFGRVGHLGVEQARASRYVYLIVALLIPLVAALLSRSLPSSVAGSAAAVLAAVFVLQATGDLRAIADNHAVHEQRLRSQVHAAIPVVESGAPLLSSHPDPIYSPNLSAPGLRALVAEGHLRPRSVPLAERLIAESWLMLTLAGERPAAAGAGSLPAGAGCVDTGDELAEVALSAELPGGTAFSVEAPGGAAELVLVATDGTAQSVARPIKVTGAVVWVHVTAPSAAAARVRIPGGGVVCVGPDAAPA